jgi:succinate-semialdehyde dehydrogenase/glutarate-semialdehyde dehydrogenase
MKKGTRPFSESTQEGGGKGTRPLFLRDPTLLETRALIGGKWVGGGKTFAVRNPATGAELAQVPDLDAVATKRAIDAASQALPGWRKKTAKERAAILRKWHELMLANQEDLAAIMTAEQGKPLTESRGEIAYAASFLEWFGEEAKRVYGDVIPSPWGDRRMLVTREPVGVCAAITPWNFPAAMLARKVGAALAAGCTMVAKPAEQTPLSAFAMALLGQRAGLPAGVLNVLTGDARAIGGELTSNPAVRKITFTGSTEVGKLLMRQSADTLKKLSLELGGNAPFIVFDDADLPAAVEGAVTAKYRNTGQTCVCANRLLVQDGIYDRFAAALAVAAAKLKVGAGTEDGVQQGPLIDAAALAKVEAHVADARAGGARVLLGGQRHALGGTFYEPTVLADVTSKMLVANEETFGPVAPLLRFRDEAEAIALANATAAGLAAYFYSRDVSRVFRVAEALQYGMVGINTGLISSEVAPFGGMKESGVGREGSKYGINDYLEIKYWCLGGLPP